MSSDTTADHPPKPFLSLEDWIDEGIAPTNLTAKMLRAFKSDSLLEATQQKLAEMGFQRLQFLGGRGDNAIAFLTTENQVVRIATLSADSDQRAEHPAVLQAIAQDVLEVPFMTIEGATPGSKINLTHKILIEVLPEVITDGITDEHRRMLRNAIEPSGYWADDWDWSGNIGLMDIKINGQLVTIPLLIDCGLLKHKPAEDQGEHEGLKPYLAANGSLAEKKTWLQCIQDPRILTQKPTGVITDEYKEHVKHILSRAPKDRDIVLDELNRVQAAGGYVRDINDASLAKKFEEGLPPLP